MFCPRCGAQNEVGAVTCLRCGTDLPKPRPVGTSETNRETATPSVNPPPATSPMSDPPSQSSAPSFADPPNYPPPPGQSFPPPPPGGQGYGSQPPYGGGQSYGSGQSDWMPGSGQQTYGNQPPYGGAPGYQIGNSPSYGSPAYGGARPTGDVPNYLIWSIVTTLLCCLPAGVVAIVYSTQVNGKLQSGDYAGAVDASKKAKMWCLISAGTSVVFFIIGILLSIANS
jgi:hypothetical protein